MKARPYMLKLRTISSCLFLICRPCLEQVPPGLSTIYTTTTSLLSPDLDSLIMTSTSQKLSIRTDGNRNNVPRMPGEGAQELSCLHIPDLDGLITTSTSQRLSIRADGNRNNLARMPGEGAQELSCL